MLVMKNKSINRYIATLVLLIFFGLESFAQSADCTPLSKVEIARKHALLANDNYITATKEYSETMRKAYDLLTPVHECQSGQTIFEKALGSCDDVINKYNLLTRQTNNLESQKDSLKSIAQAFILTYRSAAATACKQ
jgi:hypothetical protein